MAKKAETAPKEAGELTSGRSHSAVAVFLFALYLISLPICFIGRYFLNFVSRLRVAFSLLVLVLALDRVFKLFYKYAAGPVVVAALVCMIFYSFRNMNFGLQITVDGESVGFVENGSAADMAFRMADDMITANSGIIPADDHEVGYRVVIVDSSATASTDDLAEIIASKKEPALASAAPGDDIGNADADNSVPFTVSSDTVVKNFALYVDDRYVGVMARSEDIEDVIAMLVNEAATLAGADYAEVYSDIEIVDGDFSDAEMTKEELISALNANIVEQATYSIRSGDVYIRIAKKLGTTVSSLMALNPDVDPLKLRVGMEIVVSQSVPLLSIAYYKTETYTEDIPYETVTTYDPNQYVTISEVTRSGKVGKANVKAYVGYVDGIEVSRSVITQEVVKEPISKLVTVGSRELPAVLATGKLIKPVNGILTQSFGPSKNYSSGMHTGIDWGASRGTPIYAADGGTVIVSGKDKFYGNYIKIDHGNGFVTLYAHADKLIAKKGDKVVQGQKIAEVGTTGNSSGYHLHFEVILNGQYLNPAKYVK